MCVCKKRMLRSTQKYFNEVYALNMQQEHHVTEKKEEQPTAMNAFELIAMSRGLNLGNLFDVEQVYNLYKLLCSFFYYY